MRNLVRAAASLAPDQLERVVALADGNPLLALETARAIAAGRGDPSASLRGVVRAAAADLDGEARLLAELVSVAARDLEPGELERLPIANPPRAASAAIETGLLVSRSRRLAYRHALLREALYAEIPEPRRAELHERFAAVLAEQGSPRRAAEAARHLLLAGREEAAVGHLESAAEDARSVAAYAEAAEFLEQAARIAPQRASLLEELAEVEAWRGRREAALAAFERAEAALANADPGTQALAWIRRGRWLRGALCYPSESRAAYLRGLEHLDAAADPLPSARAEALAGLAWAEAVAGDAKRSQELLDRLDEDPDPDRAGALERDPPVSRPLARLARAESLVALNRLDEAEEELRATALEPLGAGDFPDTLVARLARVQGLIALARGDHALSTRRFEEAARTWRRRVEAERPGDRYMAVLADFGRPPVLGLIEPRRELERVEAELAALRETQPTTTP